MSFFNAQFLELVHARVHVRAENIFIESDLISTAHSSVYSRDSRLLLPLKRLLLVDDVMKDVQLVRRQVRQRRALAASRWRRL